MKGRRVARVVGGVLLGLVALLALVVGGALTFVRTERGGAWALGKLLPAINDQIAGHLTVSSLRLRGWRLELRGVTLRSPEGEVVAEVARLEVAAVPLAMIRQRLILDSVIVDRPALRLVQDARGLNLQRAIASRRPAPPPAAPAQPAQPSRLSMSVGTLQVRGGLVDFRSKLPGPDRHFRVEELALDGKANYQSARQALAAELRGQARFERPLAAPIALDLAAQGEGESGKAHLSIAVGDSQVKVTLAAAGRTALNLNIDRIAIEPALVQALVPGAPGPAAPVVLTGHVRRAGETVTANLALEARRGQLRVEGSADPERHLLRGLRATARDLDLSALLREGPRSALDFTLDARGSGRDLRSLRGEVKFDMPPSPLGPGRAGPVRLHARAEEDGYKLVDLLAELPGLSLRGHGSATTAKLDLVGTLVARDLARTVRALEGPGPARLPAVAGSGALRLTVSGPVKAPRLDARGVFPQLRFEANQADGLDVMLAIADLRRPQLADLRLRAPRVRLGDHPLRDVRLALSSDQPRAFTARASIAAPPLGLETRGRWSADFQGMTIEALQLAYPEARWTLVRPTRLALGERFAIEDLALVAGSQRIEATLRTGPDRLAARVAIADLDLGRLPKALVPPRLNLAGVVDLDAEVAGTPARPRGRARLALAGGRFQRLEGLGLNLDARHDGRRVAGTLAGRSSRASLTARFDLPAVWPPADRAPVSLDLKVDPFDIAALLASVGARPAMPVRGQAELKASVTGTYAHPEARLEARGQRLAVRGETLGDAHLTLAVTTPARGIEADLRLEAFGGKAALQAKAPVTVARAMRLSPQAALRLPVTVTGSADELPLRPFARLAATDAITGGVLDLKLDLEGTALAPGGDLKVRLDDLAGRQFPATDAVIALAAHAKNGPKLSARVTRKGQTLATVDASIALPTSRLRDLAALAEAPLSLRAHLGPVRLQRAGIPPRTERDKARALSGLVESKVRLEGTLRAPRLALSATAEDARLEDRRLGRADLVVRYQNARPEVALNAITANGGALHLTGSAKVDLGYPKVLKAIDPKTVPVVVDVESRELDLSAFSGLFDPVRTLAGKLSANARVRGQAGAPQIDGRIEWKEGRLVLMDLGGYEDIHLLVHGNGQQVILDDLSARAGGGNAKVTARAERDKEDAWKLTTSAVLNKFPLYTQGQPLGTLSLEARASGSASPKHVRLATRIDEAHLTLAEGKRKKIQGLQRPGDIVLLDHGKPLNRDQARRLARLEAVRKAEALPVVQARPAVPPRRIRVTVDAPRNLWIQGPDVHLELGLDEGFQVSVADETRIFGSVQVKRGRLELLGKRFDVDAGSSVRFTGPPERPELAIKATHEARKAGIGVRVALAGPLDKMSLTLSSPDNPQLGDTELMTLLATGHLPDERSGNAATPGAQAVSVLGGVLANQMQKTLARRLPLDVLVIEPGEGLSGTRLEAGTYLTDALYVAYVGRVGADPFGRENRNEVQLEYQLSRRWSFEGAYGDARRGSADLVWTKNY